MNYIETYQKFNNVKTIFNASREEEEIVYFLKNATASRRGATLYLAPTKQQAINIFRDTADNLRMLNIPIYINKDSLRITINDEIYIFKSINELRQQDGLRIKEVIFLKD